MCMSSRFEWVDLDREATLLTYTRVLMTPTSFSDRDSYVVAIGEMKNGLRVLAWLEGVTPQEVRPGLHLKLEARKSKEGRPYYVFLRA